MKTNTETIIELLKTEVESNIDFSTLKNNEPLSDQGMDSLDYLTLFLAIDETLNVKIEDEEIDDLKTVDDIVEFINKK